MKKQLHVLVTDWVHKTQPVEQCLKLVKMLSGANAVAESPVGYFMVLGDGRTY